MVSDGYELPLIVRNSLFTLPVRASTYDERINAPRIVLTSDEIWDVNAHDESDNKPIESTALSMSTTFQSYDHTMATTILANAVGSTTNTLDPQYLTRKMGWMPTEVMRRTLDVTTMMAKNYMQLPFRRHFKSRFPQVNRNRLRERYSTDTFFSSQPAFGT